MTSAQTKASFWPFTIGCAKNAFRLYFDPINGIWAWARRRVVVWRFSTDMRAAEQKTSSRSPDRREFLGSTVSYLRWGLAVLLLLGMAYAIYRNRQWFEGWHVPILHVYAYFLVFAWVLVEQFGVPLPATPILLAAGVLSSERAISLPLAFGAGLAACLISDSSWYLIGKRYGHRVLRLLCKLSMEPAICVRRTQDTLGRRRTALLYAKFVPGLTTLAPPVAGQNGMPFVSFLIFDGIGAALWLGALLTAGRLVGDALKLDPSLQDWVGRFSGALLTLAILGFFLARVYRRKRMIRKLLAARLEPDDLKRQLDSGENVYIVDLRHPLELLVDPFTLPNAVRVSPEDLAKRVDEIPRDRDVVLYCTCPSEATAVKTAMTLHKLGIERVRPLRGGYDEWKRLGYPMDDITSIVDSPILGAVDKLRQA